MYYSISCMHFIRGGGVTWKKAQASRGVFLILDEDAVEESLFDADSQLQIKDDGLRGRDGEVVDHDRNHCCCTTCAGMMLQRCW
jgi:hypothetical protein